MMRKSLVLILAIIVATICAVSAATTVRTAVCVLKATADAQNYNIKGTLTLYEDVDTGATRINGTITGLAPNSTHGFHVHQYGDISDQQSGKSVGSHFNPVSQIHDNDLDNPLRHAGDMGNLTADSNGVISVDIDEGLLWTLHGNLSVVGRAIVLHEKRDIGSANPTTGDAGLRYAQCVIGIRNTGTVENVAMADEAGPAYKYAACELFGEQSAEIFGRVVFTSDEANNQIKVSAKICGLSDGNHGFHIHTYGDLTGVIGTVGSHYNPHKTMHALPTEFDATYGHVGDMGNIDSLEQTATVFDRTFSMPKLLGNESIIGRAVIVHASQDKGKVAQPSGDSGTMLARCVIGVKDSAVSVTTITCPPPKEPSPTTSSANRTFYSPLVVLVLVIISMFSM